MTQKLLFSLLLSFCCLGVIGQPHDLVSASGASFQNSTGYLSFSIGECITTTLTSSSAVLTQGFHQTRLRTGVPVINKPQIQMSVFPNPVNDVLTLQIGEPYGFDYLLYDLRGGLIEQGHIHDVHTVIDFGAKEPAVYILTVTNHQEEVRLFQIVKY